MLKFISLYYLVSEVRLLGIDLIIYLTFKQSNPDSNLKPLCILNTLLEMSHW